MKYTSPRNTDVTRTNTDTRSRGTVPAIRVGDGPGNGREDGRTESYITSYYRARDLLARVQKHGVPRKKAGKNSER